MAKYSIQYKNETVGPMEKEQLLLYGLNQDSLLMAEGSNKWQKAFTYPEIMQMLHESKTKSTTTSSTASSTKSSTGYSVDISDLFTLRYIKPNLIIAGIGLILAGIIGNVTAESSLACVKDASVACVLLGVVLFLYFRSKKFTHSAPFSLLQKIGLGVGWTIVGVIIDATLEEVFATMSGLQYWHGDGTTGFICIIVLVALAFIVPINYYTLKKKGY